MNSQALRRRETNRRFDRPPPVDLPPLSRGVRAARAGHHLQRRARPPRRHHLGAGAKGPLVLRLLRQARASATPCPSWPRPSARSSASGGSGGSSSSAPARSARPSPSIAASASAASASSPPTTRTRRRSGTPSRGSTVRDMARLEEDVAREQPDIAVLAIPSEDAQAVLDRVVKAGVKAMLNFAPAQLHAPADVTVKTVNMAMELEGLSLRAHQPRRGLTAPSGGVSVTRAGASARSSPAAAPRTARASASPAAPRARSRAAASTASAPLRVAATSSERTTRRICLRRIPNALCTSVRKRPLLLGRHQRRRERRDADDRALHLGRRRERARGHAEQRLGVRHRGHVHRERAVLLACPAPRRSGRRPRAARGTRRARRAAGASAWKRIGVVM